MEHIITTYSDLLTRNIYSTQQLLKVNNKLWTSTFLRLFKILLGVWFKATVIWLQFLRRLEGQKPIVLKTVPEKSPLFENFDRITRPDLVALKSNFYSSINI